MSSLTSPQSNLKRHLSKSCSSATAAPDSKLHNSTIAQCVLSFSTVLLLSDAIWCADSQNKSILDVVLRLFSIQTIEEYWIVCRVGEKRLRAQQVPVPSGRRLQPQAKARAGRQKSLCWQRMAPMFCSNSRSCLQRLMSRRNGTRGHS